MGGNSTKQPRFIVRSLGLKTYPIQALLHKSRLTRNQLLDFFSAAEFIEKDAAVTWVFYAKIGSIHTLPESMVSQKRKPELSSNQFFFVCFVVSFREGIQ